MTNASVSHTRWNAAVVCRLAVTVVSILVVETIVCGLAALPVVVFWLELSALTTFSPLGRAAAFSIVIVPSYVAFALCVMGTSALATWVTGARTPANAEMRIADMGWPLMRWARYMVASHLVRLVAGGLFRGFVSGENIGIADVAGEKRALLPGHHLGRGQRLPIHRFEQVLLPDESQFFPVRVVGKCLDDVRAGVDELTMELSDEVRMLQHHFRSIGPGLQVPASFELEEVPLGADHRTSFEPVQEAESSRDRGITHVPSPSFREAPDNPVPESKSLTEHRFVAESRLERRVGERLTVRSERLDWIVGPPIES